MIDCLKSLKEKESLYKETVDNANAYLQGEFRTSIDRLTKELIPILAPVVQPSETSNHFSVTDTEKDMTLGVEGTRCDAVHEALNKFVVYEKFAEMTHKYDVGNFSKLLDDYNTPDELSCIREHLEIDRPKSKLDSTPIDDGGHPSSPVREEEEKAA
jgi:hypothetical protein